MLLSSAELFVVVGLGKKSERDGRSCVLSRDRLPIRLANRKRRNSAGIRTIFNLTCLFEIVDICQPDTGSQLPRHPRFDACRSCAAAWSRCCQGPACPRRASSPARDAAPSMSLGYESNLSSPAPALPTSQPFPCSRSWCHQPCPEHLNCLRRPSLELFPS